MTDYTLYYWPVPFRGQFIRAILAHAGKTWDEPDDVGALTGAAPDTQPAPFMGPPVLIDRKTGFKLSQMSAIAFYLGETLDLLPPGAEGRATSLKIVNDANDVIDDITLDGGREMWTPETWKAYVPRLERWMAIFEAGAKHGKMTREGGYFAGNPHAGIADIVAATMWGTLGERFPPIAQRLRDKAPLTAGLTERMMATPRLSALAEDSRKRFGDAYCGGQIEASMRKVINGEATG